MMNEATPSLSIVIVPLSGGPVLGALLAQLTAEGELPDDAELVVVTTEPAPATLESKVLWIAAEPEHSVALRRGLGLRQARANVIAFIDDTMRPLPGWARAVIALHAELAEADAIGGTLQIAPGLTPLETALIALDHGRFLRQGWVSTTSETLPANNMSFRRSALERVDAFTIDPFREADVVRALARRLGSVRCESRMAAVCVSANPLATTLLDRFERGRLHASERFETGHRAERIARAATAPFLGTLLATRAMRSLRGVGIASAPRTWAHLARMSGAWSLGQTIGYLSGPPTPKG